MKKVIDPTPTDELVLRIFIIILSAIAHFNVHILEDGGESPGLLQSLSLAFLLRGCITISVLPKFAFAHKTILEGVFIPGLVFVAPMVGLTVYFFSR